MRKALAALVTAPLLLLACAGDEPANDEPDEESPESGESGDNDKGEIGGDPIDPFAEVYDQGLTAYLGTVEPAKTLQDGDETHYLFNRADGPMCLRGGRYWMSVRRGIHDGGDLVIFQQGGGACWSDLCSASEDLGPPYIPPTGMLNPWLPDNAFADWNVVYLPYCDGSLFVGDVEIDDDLDGEIDRFHHGLINLSAGLDVAKREFPDASRIVLAGSSAGSYGVHVSNMLVRALWPEAELVVVADCGLGIGRPGDFEFIPELLAEWNALRLVPASCTECVTDHITGLPSWQLARDPKMRFAAISSYDDVIIGGLFLQLGPGEYEAALTSELARLAAAHPGRYHRFLFASTLHTTIAADTQSGGGFDGLTATYDGTRVDGTSVARWLDLLIREDPDFGDRID